MTRAALIIIALSCACAPATPPAPPPAPSSCRVDERRLSAHIACDNGLNVFIPRRPNGDLARAGCYWTDEARAEICADIGCPEVSE